MQNSKSKACSSFRGEVPQSFDQGCDMRFSRIISSFFSSPSFRSIVFFLKYSFLPLSATLPSMSSSWSGFKTTPNHYVDCFGRLIVDIKELVWRCEDRQTSNGVIRYHSSYNAIYDISQLRIGTYTEQTNQSLLIFVHERLLLVTHLETTCTRNQLVKY